MNASDYIQVALYLGVLVALTPPLGKFIKKVANGETTFLSRFLLPVENLIYRFTGIDPAQEMTWKTFMIAAIFFKLASFVLLFLILIAQGFLPLNPQGLPGVPVWLAFNTAVSFMTNTNWQAYAGETTLSYFSQMVGLTVQNFVSAAGGIAILFALVRGLVRHSATTLGNFWADLVRVTLYVLVPLCVVWAVLLAGQGVVQTFSSYATATTVQGQQQVIPVGPAASQIAIKQLGTNGGGFFNANSAHPFENPTPFSNFLEMLAILLIPFALTYTYGLMVGSKRQGWSIFAAMMILYVAALGVSLSAEYQYNPVMHVAGSMEGKETRFGVTNSIIWSTSTTVTSNGSVNSMHESLSPLAGGVAMFNMMLGEVVFGGVGCGMYGMLMFVILTVFIAGLMVGRTPEYLGKKIEAFEIKMAVIAVLAPSIAILVGTAISSVIPAGLSSLENAGPHGFSEILYAFTSAAANNGSAFAGLNANTDYYNILLGITMLIGRFAPMIPVLAIAGSIVKKKTIPPSPGTFPTDGILFSVLLIGVIIIVGALTFFPALSLGPIIEHFLMLSGRAL
jgi:K+-transporting ATPase ATPase A chain